MKKFNGGSLILCLAALLLLCHSVAALKLGELCFADTCDVGLSCEMQPRCIRIKPVDPFSRVFGLPFNRYSWLTTHHAFANPEESASMKSLKHIMLDKVEERTPFDRAKLEVLALMTQPDSVPTQLNNGVRGFMLDMYDYQDEVWLCRGTCNNITAFEPAIHVLTKVREFLEANPNEIITIIIEDYVTSPYGLTDVFDDAGLRKFWFPVSRMPKEGGDWPTVDDMIEKNQRLVVFTSNSSKEATEDIAYQWKYTVENRNGSGGMVAGKCLNRKESPAMKSTTRSLIVMNYFPDIPDVGQAHTHNSAPLMKMLHTCYEAAGKRWPNFIAVDYYMKSDGGGAPQAVDKANGQLICGRPNILSCRGFQGQNEL